MMLVHAGIPRKRSLSVRIMVGSAGARFTVDAEAPQLALSAVESDGSEFFRMRVYNELCSTF